jgi:hypothetical protein
MQERKHTREQCTLESVYKKKLNSLIYKERTPEITHSYDNGVYTFLRVEPL